MHIHASMTITEEEAKGNKETYNWNRIAQTSMFSSGFGTCRQDDDGITRDAMQVCNVYVQAFFLSTSMVDGDLSEKKTNTKHSC